MNSPEEISPYEPFLNGPTYTHTEVFGKWENGNYSSTVVKTEMTLDELAEIVSKKF